MIEIIRYDGLSGGIIDDASATLADGDTIGISCIGSTISAWRKPAAGVWTLLLETEDATYNYTGYIGWELAQGNMAVDDFGGGASSSGNIPPISIPTVVGRW